MDTIFRLQIEESPCSFKVLRDIKIEGNIEMIEFVVYANKHFIYDKTYNVLHDNGKITKIVHFKEQS
jgi:hypothetical protein